MKKILMTALLISSMWATEIEVGKVLPSASITEDDGGYVNGGTFTTDDLRGKVYVFMYVDPDESDAGENLNEALKEAKKTFPEGTYTSVAVINMAATWLPNFAIRSKLRSKQEKYPGAFFVKDEGSVFVKALGLKDDAYEAMIIDSKGTVVRKVQAPFSSDEVTTFVNTVKKLVANLH